MQSYSNLIERYTVAEPANERIDYTKMLSCETLPVFYSNEYSHDCMHYKWTQMPTRIVFPFLRDLYKLPLNVVTGNKKRTIHIINLNNNKKLYILPNLENVEEPKMIYDKDIAFNVSPEINKAIVQAKQFYTR